MAVITLNSVTPAVFPGKGGLVISIAAPPAEFSVTSSYVVYLGINGTIADDPCYSGVIGNAYACTPVSDILLTCVTPPLPRSDAIFLTVVSGVDSGQIASLDAIEDSYFDQLFEMRKHWTRWHDTGPRSLSLEPRQDT